MAHSPQDDDVTAGMTPEEASEARERLAELEARMQEVDAETAQKFADMERKQNQIMADKFRQLEEQQEASLGNMMSNVAKRYESHVHGIVANQQTEMLRINKVIREVSRGLGSYWKPVFEEITSSVPRDVVDAEIEKIERTRPFMQAYNALMAWKRLLGEELSITQLSRALSNNGLVELAELALNILDSDHASLLKIGRTGVGLEGGAAALRRKASAAQEPSVRGPCDKEDDSAVSDMADRAAAMRDAIPARDDAMMETYLQGALGERALLKIARGVDTEWRRLGDVLQLSTEELDEIGEKESATYRAAYKVMWSWRDTAQGTEAEKAAVLSRALTACGKGELAQQLKA